MAGQGRGNVGLEGCSRGDDVEKVERERESFVFDRASVLDQSKDQSTKVL
jgi:hypothetical protein